MASYLESVYDLLRLAQGDEAGLYRVVSTLVDFATDVKAAAGAETLGSAVIGIRHRYAHRPMILKVKGISDDPEALVRVLVLVSQSTSGALAPGLILGRNMGTNAWVCFEATDIVGIEVLPGTTVFVEPIGKETTTWYSANKAPK